MADVRRVEEKEPFVFMPDGDDLAKVLSWYGYTFGEMSGGGKIICPFHGDVNPSMAVDLSDGSYFCFGCNAAGDAYDFVRMMEPRLSELQAVRKMFRIIWSRKMRGVSSGKALKVDRALHSPEAAHDYYLALPKTDWQGDEPEAVMCREYMKQRGFLASTLETVGAKVTYSSQYPIIFPIMDNSEFKGWVRRTMDPETEAKRKYLYNKGFSRMTTLAGFYGKLPYVFVVEGYMDMMRFVQYGCRNVVAVLGWKMTRPQEEKLKDSGVCAVISALDNDECGRRGTEYLRTRFKAVFRFRYMKGVKDPGEMDERQFWKMYARTMEGIFKASGVFGAQNNKEGFYEHFRRD